MKQIMKKVMFLCIALLFSLPFIRTNLKASLTTEQEYLFKDFIPTKVIKVYNITQKDDGEYDAKASLYLYDGKINNIDGYILYDFVKNEIIEYSLNSLSPWEENSYGYGDNSIPLYFEQSGYHMRTTLGTDIIHNCDLSYSITDSTVEAIQSLLSPLSDVSLDTVEFSLTTAVIKFHTIEKSFYFENLNNNFGDNINGSCGYVAIGMLLSYANEFLDSTIVPKNFSFNKNGTIYNIDKNSVYSKVSQNEYNISNFNNSPGANELFHQFLINYGSNILNNNGNLIYGLSEDDMQKIMLTYLNSFYENYDKIGLRKVTNERYINESSYEETYGFTENYEYYEGKRNRNDIISNVDGNNYEYEFDIIKELDNDNPVILTLTYNANNFYQYLGPIRNIDGSVEQAVFTPYNGHAVIAYGYVQTSHGIFYKCHMGWKDSTGVYKFSDIYVKASDILHGFVLKKFDHDYEYTLESSYVYSNGECELTIPTQKIYSTKREFVKETCSLTKDNNYEYYYCSEHEHLIYKSAHEYNFESLNNQSHLKYCDCGIEFEVAHTFVHYDDYNNSHDHVAYCTSCCTGYYDTDGITYSVDSEFRHCWVCTKCNKSGISTHDIGYIEIDSVNHARFCKVCEYFEHLSHYSAGAVEYYYENKEYHYAFCLMCGARWLEHHKSDKSCCVMQDY